MEIPPSSDDPPPRPSLLKYIRPNRGKTLAIVDLNKSLAARADPMWLGYDSEIYIMIERKVRYIPGRYSAAAIMGTILYIPTASVFASFDVFIARSSSPVHRWTRAPSEHEQ